MLKAFLLQYVWHHSVQNIYAEKILFCKNILWKCIMLWNCCEKMTLWKHLSLQKLHRENLMFWAKYTVKAYSLCGKYIMKAYSLYGKYILKAYSLCRKYIVKAYCTDEISISDVNRHRTSLATIYMCLKVYCYKCIC